MRPDGPGGVRLNGVDGPDGTDAVAVEAMALDDLVHGRLLAEPVGAVVDARGTVERIVRIAAPLLGSSEASGVIERVLARVEGLGPLDPLLADPSVTEVMVNGGGAVWVERDGRLAVTDVALHADTVAHLIERVVSPLGLRIDRSSPLVDARLPDGSRVNAVVPPLAIDGPCLTIRRFGARPVDLTEVCPPGVAPLLRWAVAARANIVVCGGSGSGKTTLLNALAASVPPGERVITIEDAAELRLPGDHVVRLESRPPNAEGVGAVSIRDLVRNSLRMRPDRIIVGEVRGPEVLEMVQAMTTGHEGSLSTCHANSPVDALRRLETMMLMGGLLLPLAAVRDHLGAAIDLVVQVARRPDGSRRVVAVDEVAEPGSGCEGSTRPLVGRDGLSSLPRRPVRWVGAEPPRPSWVVAA